MSSAPWRRVVQLNLYLQLGHHCRYCLVGLEGRGAIGEMGAADMFLNTTGNKIPMS
jgi:hypothetical protein